MSTTNSQSCLPACAFLYLDNKTTNKGSYEQRYYQYMYDLRANSMGFSSSGLNGSYFIVVSKVGSFLRQSGGEDRVIFSYPQQCPSKIDPPFYCPLLLPLFAFLPPLFLSFLLHLFIKGLFFCSLPLFFPSFPPRPKHK